MKFIEYSGEQPVLINPANTEKIISIIESQLKILEKLCENKLLVHRGSNLRMKETIDEKPSNAGF